MTNTNQTLFGVKATSKATDQQHKNVLGDIRNIISQMDEISQRNFAPSTYTSDRVVRVQYIGCVDNSLLIFVQFVN